MEIDWENVSWGYVAVLAVFVFVTNLIGNLLSLHRHVLGSVLSAVLFSMVFIFWTYYPHHLPLPTRLSEAGPVAAKSVAPQRPSGRFEDVSPTKPGR